MTTLLARIALSAALLQSLAPASAVQEPAQEYGWDCPGSGYLPFRKELLVSTDDLARLLESGEATVLHVGYDPSGPASRRRPTYAEGHVPGARHLPWASLQGPIESLHLESLGIEPGRRVVVYDTGLGLEAAAALVALEAAGLADQAQMLDGQWVKWASEGRPLCLWTEEAEATMPASPPTGPGLSRKELDRRILRADGAFPGFTLIDARAGLGVRGRTPSWVQRIPWTGNLASLSLPLFKGEAELRRLWSKVPAGADARVVVAARDWREAAPVYFAARLLGYSAEFFDGSIDDLEPALESLERGP
jgi:3-mercaptopyruvate sulfurtransferase SseA